MIRFSKSILLNGGEKMLNLLGSIMVILMMIIGGVITVALFASIFVIIVWKIYRKCKYGLSLYD